MSYDVDDTGRSRLTPALDSTELDRTDRLLLGSSAGVWLVALGTAVAATVALVDLGTAHTAPVGASGTPWGLYGVIAVSAAVIAGAVPLLLRARREAMADTSAGPRAEGVSAPHTPAGGRGAAPRAPYAAPRALRTPEAAKIARDGAVAAAERLWLRCALVIICAMGVAMVTIGVATYLMAVGSDLASWILYGLTAVIIVAMPVAPWYYLKEMRALLNQ
ncbi:Protein of uncharacterised function (DUF2561) [Mycolicibacterium phlei]|jgi:hypothetical protein|uniref:Transmembrane protein n=1 Tax=Mycolicibacterium phlei DSM 43239 = CCUG 21000 TaxID=1226750 RepID=A0A5N5V8S5_MYCPH|nr:DUF2561 family protein [Mycolicibacterium phlei]VEG10238.1 Protein of uncharacterised function (DUF2561) [Mycobacteroides chelonae]AMO62133.1 hypothetical protein MPHLCCUG_03329 [Mycolicibacterium phlei]EID14291.1 hypothetical protein MPHLEI_12004 [Mycolicibacterium phlei RIVM601174]KAB7757040.1 hypothetical protein MPHL21000_09090 [Mycolicibacterium phlei DSM 43239 = CCUG 21000]KXW62556.1 hypothetical protein MPHL43070_06275 [Mycolicibacterium phlei DSM 43070]